MNYFGQNYDSLTINFKFIDSGASVFNETMSFPSLLMQNNAVSGGLLKGFLREIGVVTDVGSAINLSRQ